MNRVETNVVLTAPEPGKVEVKVRPYPHVKAGDRLLFVTEANGGNPNESSGKR